VLFGLSFAAEAGECVTLLGRNGMGKTTTVKSVIGMLRSRKGGVRFDGTDISGWPSYRIAQAGVGLVPEMRQIFPTLSVRENLVATARTRVGVAAAPWTLDRVYAYSAPTPRASNMGGRLSGGEQQMLRSGAPDGESAPGSSTARRLARSCARKYGVLGAEARGRRSSSSTRTSAR
jgi:branched-chain amino acid transport system ATP-binding protein